MTDREVVSHNQNSITSTPVEYSSAILLLADDCDVVGIDEAQFFDEGIVDVANQLANEGKRVIVAGLDMDFKGRPFGPYAQSNGDCRICDQSTCNLRAYRKFSQLFAQKNMTVIVLSRLGETSEYEPLSRVAFGKNITNKKLKTYNLNQISSITNGTLIGNEDEIIHQIFFDSRMIVNPTHGIFFAFTETKKTGIYICKMLIKEEFENFVVEKA